MLEVYDKTRVSWISVFVCCVSLIVLGGHVDAAICIYPPDHAAAYWGAGQVSSPPLLLTPSFDDNLKLGNERYKGTQIDQADQKLADGTLARTYANWGITIVGSSDPRFGFPTNITGFDFTGEGCWYNPPIDPNREIMRVEFLQN